MKKKHEAIKYELNPMSLMALVLSFASLTIVTTMIFVPRQSNSYHLLLAIDTMICLVFWLQLLTDLVRSDNKRAYLKAHWLDFLASIPVIEPFRFGRLLQIFRVIRLIRSSRHVINQIRSHRREATLASIFLLLTVLISVGSAMMLIIEGNVPESNIKDAFDALWWVIVTISTVGYGDHYPVTLLGKMLATVMIICGVGLFGMVAGLVTSFISDPEHSQQRNAERHEKEWQQMLRHQEMLLNRLEALEQRLSQREQQDKQDKQDN
ncbi:ion transporter [Photobacterium ganghwense]|uniref:ion transporter n=1 Tax=Photobacterium ganghwense TaxID=320778 RepID=UPI001C2DA1AA|nr:ion transporter [Photobacterium ganghwense]MBV1842654.1 ion transporter [Photobacterium ganghwense]